MRDHGGDGLVHGAPGGAGPEVSGGLPQHLGQGGDGVHMGYMGVEGGMGGVVGAGAGGGYFGYDHPALPYHFQHPYLDGTHLVHGHMGPGGVPVAPALGGPAGFPGGLAGPAGFGGPAPGGALGMQSIPAPSLQQGQGYAPNGYAPYGQQQYPTSSHFGPQ